MQIGLNSNKKMLSEIDQIISDDITIADTMNKHFVNITKKSKLDPTQAETEEDTLPKILDWYQGHQNKSITNIWSQINDEKNLFSFKLVASEEVLKIVYSLKNNKWSLKVH